MNFMLANKISIASCRCLDIAFKCCNKGMTFIQLIFCIPRTVPRSLIRWSFPAGFSSPCQYYFLWYHGLWNIAPVKCSEDSPGSVLRQTHSGYSLFPGSGENFSANHCHICVKAKRFQHCVHFDIDKLIFHVSLSWFFSLYASFFICFSSSVPSLVFVCCGVFFVCLWFWCLFFFYWAL